MVLFHSEFEKLTLETNRLLLPGFFLNFILNYVTWSCYGFSDYFKSTISCLEIKCGDSEWLTLTKYMM